LVIENDSPWVPDNLIIDTLSEEGHECNEI
jgi:hypothetical protein